MKSGRHEHCWLEIYSAPIRLPPPRRAPGGVVRDFLAMCFREPLLRLTGAAFREFVLALSEREVSGGATYDALVAATAAAHRAELVTCDRHAAAVCERYGGRTRIP